MNRISVLLLTVLLMHATSLNCNVKGYIVESSNDDGTLTEKLYSIAKNVFDDTFSRFKSIRLPVERQNACVWKICSKPLKIPTLKGPELYKESLKKAKIIAYLRMKLGRPPYHLDLKI